MATGLEGAVRTRATVGECLVADSGWHKGFRLVDYQPGNGTRYVVAFQRVPFADSSSDSGVAVLERVGLPLEVAIVSWIHEGKCMALDLDGGVLHWSYVQEKLRCNEPSAVVLAELFAFVLGRTAMTSQQWLQAKETR